MPRVDTDRRLAGERAEQLAVEYLEARGVSVVLRNFRRRAGELDIVARDGEVLSIVEVRMRTSAAFGGAAASVDGIKRAKIVRTARQLLQRHRELARLPVRFDVVLVGALDEQPVRIEWIRHAFEA
ncbi:MAG: YraN family protein [Steroidobacteraceae bacterium]